ncbi:MAG TPA: acyl-CoA dehydrogenase family protein, partial [Acidimicrobiales bacterium]|nr:acyl-CoA dehydrogenase family protein [Acidimicrobiales bacterium]
MEILGASEALLTLGVEHARSRQQFGQPIASFQAVRHLLALTWLDVQALRHLCLAALRSIDSGDARLAELTKAVAGRNGRRTADRTQQVIGAIGFTWEHQLHRLYRRVLVLDSLLVGSDAVLGELARGAADGANPASLLPLIASAGLAAGSSSLTRSHSPG